MTTITIPAAVVPHACEGARYLLQLAANEVGGQTECITPELEGPLQRFYRARALVEALPRGPGGVSPWGRPHPSGAVEVDEAHAPLLREALWEATTVQAHLADETRLGQVALKRAGEHEDLLTYTAQLQAGGGA